MRQPLIRPSARTMLAAALGLLAGGCPLSIQPLAGDAATDTGVGSTTDVGSEHRDAGSDIVPRVSRACEVDGAGVRRSLIDLLFVVDNSSSTLAQQDRLAAQLPFLMNALTTGTFTSTDCAGDRTSRAFPRAEDIHIGVVTTDLGSLDYNLPTCPTTFGDDGVLRTQGNTSLVFSSGAMCQREYGTEFTPLRRYVDGAGRESATLAREIECIVRMGTGGCGFEQPLEAALKAITPAESTTRFARDTRGHGGARGLNSGFLRPESILVVVFLTDEDDCSVRDPRLLLTSGGPYNAPLNLRCVRFPSALSAIDRYLDGLRAVRPEPGTLIVGGIVGVPGRVADTACHAVSAEEILSDPEMQHTEVPSSPTPSQQAACSGAGARALPGRRMVSAVKGFGDFGVITSICDDDYRGAMETLLDRVARGIAQVCR